MPTHAERRALPYSSRQMFDLVADVASYPQFLPWCLAARIIKHDGHYFEADLVIGYKLVRERFSSKVRLAQHHRIDVQYSEGPFRYLNNHWIFEDAPDGGCVIDFYVDFEFRSRMLQKIIQTLFHEAVRRMVAAFEARAVQLYGAAPNAARR